MSVTNRVHLAISDDRWRWKIQWVPSHKAISTSVSQHQAWCIYHNDVADSVAKQANFQHDELFMYVHSLVLRQFQTHATYSKALLHQQLQTSDLAKTVRVMHSNGARPDKFDCMFLKKERLPMLSCDRTRSIPNAGVAFQPIGYIMQLQYAELVWSFLTRQQWIQDSSGCSTAEIYVLFLLQTGLYVPMNLSGFSLEECPPSLRPAAPHIQVWAHELEWPALKLARQPFAVQLRSFRHILSSILHLQGVDWEILQLPSLRALAYTRSYSSLPYRPRATCNAAALGGGYVHCSHWPDVLTTPKIRLGC